MVAFEKNLKKKPFSPNVKDSLPKNIKIREY